MFKSRASIEEQGASYEHRPQRMRQHILLALLPRSCGRRYQTRCTRWLCSEKWGQTVRCADCVLYTPWAAEKPTFDLHLTHTSRREVRGRTDSRKWNQRLRKWLLSRWVKRGSAGVKARVTADSKMQCSDVDLSVCKVGVSVLEDLLEGC